MRLVPTESAETMSSSSQSILDSLKWHRDTALIYLEARACAGSNAGVEELVEWASLLLKFHTRRVLKRGLSTQREFELLNRYAFHPPINFRGHDDALQLLFAHADHLFEPHGLSLRARRQHLVRTLHHATLVTACARARGGAPAFDDLAALLGVDERWRPTYQALNYFYENKKWKK